MKTLWRRLRDREDGNVAIYVLAFSMIATLMVTGIGAMMMSNSITGLMQRINQAAEASVRTAIDATLAEVNRGGDDTQSILDRLVAEGREFEIDEGGTVRGATTITAATLDDQRVRLELSVASTGRVSWERRGIAQLRLADAVSLSRIDDGRAVWDYAAVEGANSDPSHVVALWSAGDVQVVSPSDEQASAPNPAHVVSTIGSDGTARVETRHAGGCLAGEAHVIETRFAVGDGGWSSWQQAPSSGPRVDEIALGVGGAGQFEARARCARDGGWSNWAHRSLSIAHANVELQVDAPTVSQSSGGVTVTAPSVDAPAGSRLVVQVRHRIGAEDWGDWTTAESMSVSAGPGVQVTAEARARALLPGGADTSWWTSSTSSATAG